jgi:hypothetical protein
MFTWWIWSALCLRVRRFAVIFLLHRDTMLFVLFQDFGNVDERVRFESLRDGG